MKPLRIGMPALAELPDLPPGNGSLDVQAIFGFAQKQGYSVLLEVKTSKGLKESAGYVKSFSEIIILPPISRNFYRNAVTTVR